MTKSEKAAFVRATLAELYPHPPIPLHHNSPFQLLIAVLLSAQCTDARVNKITPALFSRAPDAKRMSELPESEIRTMIQSCGLANNKARFIAALAHDLISRYEGQVPSTLAALEALPGVGHKTASVLVAQAFGQPAFPVDTHIHRLARRWGLSSGKNVIQTEKDLKRLFSQKDWNRLHLQIIYFGREYCPARGHDKAKCPICSVIAR
jgi:endonuclease-3